MNIPTIYMGKDSKGNVYVGASCFENDTSLHKNGLPAIIYTVHGPTLKTISFGCITADKKTWGHSAIRSRIRKSMFCACKKNGERLVEFEEK